MLIYLASPYTHEDESMREYRFQAVCKVAALLMQQGMHIYAPIVHSHPIAKYGLPKDWKYWEEYDRKFLAVCGRMLILMLPGWKNSVGIIAETQIAKELSIPINFVTEGGLILTQ